jgi:hypothetical protein
MKKQTLDSLDGLFEMLSTKVDLKTGEDIILKDQITEYAKK